MSGDGGWGVLVFFFAASLRSITELSDPSSLGHVAVLSQNQGAKSILRGGSQTVTGAPIYQLPFKIYSRIVVDSSARESTGCYGDGCTNPHARGNTYTHGFAMTCTHTTAYTSVHVHTLGTLLSVRKEEIGREERRSCEIQGRVESRFEPRMQQ